MQTNQAAGIVLNIIDEAQQLNKAINALINEVDQLNDLKEKQTRTIAEQGDKIKDLEVIIDDQTKELQSHERKKPKK